MMKTDCVGKSDYKWFNQTHMFREEQSEIGIKIMQFSH